MVIRQQYDAKGSKQKAVNNKFPLIYTQNSSLLFSAAAQVPDLLSGVSFALFPGG